MYGSPISQGFELSRDIIKLLGYNISIRCIFPTQLLFIKLYYILRVFLCNSFTRLYLLTWSRQNAAGLAGFNVKLYIRQQAPAEVNSGRLFIQIVVRIGVRFS